MDAARSIQVLRQIAGALHDAHGAGLTQRDIKPGNVMLGARRRTGCCQAPPRFGSRERARHRCGCDRWQHGRQHPGRNGAWHTGIHPCGPNKSAPGPASDLCGLGAPGCFLLTRGSPFEKRAPLQMMLTRLSEAPPLMRAIRPETPVALDAVRQLSLSGRPKARYESARPFVDALVQAFAIP